MPVNVLPVLARTSSAARANAAVLDRISATPRPAKPATTPISKQLLSTIFSSPPRNHVFVENDQENHFIYGLVLPLVARVLAVSTPGLLVVVQLPRPDVVPEWAAPAFGGYRSNGSGSKSAAPTTPSPQGTSRTPSPSDDGLHGRKSLSPDRPSTDRLIRHADKLLSSAESQKRPPRDNRSPPPDSVIQDHAALRLICNGFEVLTGKMPPLTYDMGAFTLASVAWEKAGVLEPEHPGKGVSMSFSNGMMTPTDGIVVTFSNGSLCLLTTRDPLAGLDALKISPDTPVVVFSFAAVGYASVADLLAMKADALTPAAARVRDFLEKPNFFFVEIGHSGALPNSMAECPGVPQPAAGEETGVQGKDGAADAKDDKAAPNCPPILISSVPRAIPLFVNTINQTFIDHPHYEHANEYEPGVGNDRFPEREAPRDRPDNRHNQNQSQSDRPPRPEGTAENKEEAQRKDVVATSSAPETSRPPAGVGAEPAKPLPPVHEVVRMSQGLPGGPRHHAPMYNYRYPPNHTYASNPQSHHVVPHHLPPVHQGQSMGNPYYMPGHANGHTGHAAQYQPRSYPNSYYHQPVVPSHENWHRVPHYHGMAPHPMEARRDMPAQFAHRADGQYGGSYYPTMQHGEMYRSQQHVGVPGSGPMPAGQPHPHTLHSSFPGGGANPPPGGDGAIHQPPPGQMVPSIPGGARLGEEGKQGMSGAGDGAREKENALEALMHMRSREPETRREHRSPLRRARRTETSSSTSTNSGGCTLVNGAVVGQSNAHLPHPKRRKR